MLRHPATIKLMLMQVQNTMFSDAISEHLLSCGCTPTPTPPPPPHFFFLPLPLYGLFCWFFICLKKLASRPVLMKMASNQTFVGQFSQGNLAFDWSNQICQSDFLFSYYRKIDEFLIEEPTSRQF